MNSLLTMLGVFALIGLALGAFIHVPIWRDIMRAVQQVDTNRFFIELTHARQAMAAAFAAAVELVIARTYAFARLCRSVLSIGSGSSDAPAMKGSPSMFMRC